MLCKVGTLTTSGGTNDSFSGFGFQPKAIIVATVDGDEGTFGTPTISWGFTSGVGSDAALFATFDRSVSSYVTEQWPNMLARAGGITMSLGSFDPDGFSAVLSPSVASDFYFMGFGGATLSAKVTSFTAPNGYTGNVSVTGLGFSPEWLIGGFPDYGPSRATWGHGMTHAASLGAMMQQSAGLFDSRGTDYRPGEISGSVTLVSLDADGYTVHVVDEGLTIVYAYLALADSAAAFFTGQSTQKTSAGVQSVNGVGFSPGAGIFGGVGRAGVPLVGDTTIPDGISFAFTDGTDSRGIAIGFKGAATHEGASTKYTGYLIDTFQWDTSAVQARAALQSFDADGFTLNWDTADAQARGYHYSLFETENHPTTHLHLLPILGVGA